MYQFGDDAVTITDRDLYDAAGVTKTRFYRNFQNLNIVFYWCKYYIRVDFLAVAKIVKEKKEQPFTSYAEWIKPEYVVQQLLFKILGRQTLVQFAVRKFNASFWKDALTPVLSQFLQFPGYVTEEEKGAMIWRFAGEFEVEIRLWSEKNFDASQYGNVRKALIDAFARRFGNYYI